MSDVDNLVRELADIEQIKRLQSKYFRQLDLRDPKEWGSVFAENAVMEVPEADQVFTGRETIVETVFGLIEGATSVHHGHMPDIELTSETTATGIWAMQDFVEWPANEAGERVGIVGYGWYVVEYAKIDGTWQIARQRLDRIRVDPLPN